MLQEAQNARQEVLEYQDEEMVVVDENTSKFSRLELCNCIIGLRALGVEIYGDAYTHKPNSMPFVGAVALFNYDGVAHGAKIVEIYGDYFIVEETNYKECQFTRREVRWDDPSLRGFLNTEAVELPD